MEKEARKFSRPPVDRANLQGRVGDLEHRVEILESSGSDSSALSEWLNHSSPSTLFGSPADLAYWINKKDPEEDIKKGEVILFDTKESTLTKNTTPPDHKSWFLSVFPTNAWVKANQPQTPEKAMKMALVALLGFVDVLLAADSPEPNKGDWLVPSGEHDGRAMVVKKKCPNAFAAISEMLPRSESVPRLVRAWLHPRQMYEEEPSSTLRLEEDLGAFDANQISLQLTQAQGPLEVGRVRLNWTKTRWRSHVHFYAQLACQSGLEHHEDYAFDKLVKEFDEDLNNGGGLKEEVRCSWCALDPVLLTLLCGPYNKHVETNPGFKKRIPLLRSIDTTSPLLWMSRAYMCMKLENKRKSLQHLDMAKSYLDESHFCEHCRPDLQCELLVMNQQARYRGGNGHQRLLGDIQSIETLIKGKDDSSLESVLQTSLAWSHLPGDLGSDKHIEYLTHRGLESFEMKLDEVLRAVEKSEELNPGNYEALQLRLKVLSNKVSLELARVKRRDGHYERLEKYHSQIKELCEKVDDVASYLPVHSARLGVVYAFVNVMHRCASGRNSERHAVHPHCMDIYPFAEQSYKICIEKDTLKSYQIHKWGHLSHMLHSEHTKEYQQTLQKANARLDKFEHDRPLSGTTLINLVSVTSTLANMYYQRSLSHAAEDDHNAFSDKMESAKNNWRCIRYVSRLEALLDKERKDRHHLMKSHIFNAFFNLEIYYNSKSSKRQFVDFMNRLEALLRLVVHLKAVEGTSGPEVDRAKKSIDKIPEIIEDTCFQSAKIDKMIVLVFVRRLCDFHLEKYIGHPDVANILSKLGAKVEYDLISNLETAARAKSSLEEILGYEVQQTDREVWYCLPDGIPQDSPKDGRCVDLDALQLWRKDGGGRISVFISRILFISVEKSNKSLILRRCVVSGMIMANTKEITAAKNMHSLKIK